MINSTFASLLIKMFGELSEWLKEHAWKVCIPLKGIEGSNPSLSASIYIKRSIKPATVSLRALLIYASNARCSLRFKN